LEGVLAQMEEEQAGTKASSRNSTTAGGRLLPLQERGSSPFVGVLKATTDHGF